MKPSRLEVELLDIDSSDAADNNGIESMNEETEINTNGPHTTPNSETKPDELKEPSSAAVDTARSEAFLGGHEYNGANSREL
jgi:hypothetical protein